MLGINETRFLVQYESCKCKYGLDESVCNSNSKWNNDDCWCVLECKELDDWISCKGDYKWNPCTCDCELNKA